MSRKILVILTLCLCLFFPEKGWSRKNYKKRHLNSFRFTHTVRRGETLYSISLKYGTSVYRLKKTNHITKNTIYPGQKLGIFRKKKSDRPLKCCYKWPVKGTVISKYGMNNNIKQNGIKIKAKEGTLIRAIWHGKVVFSGVGPKCMGNMIILNHGNFFSVYAHNLLNKVKNGKKIKTGEGIGIVGSTGCIKNAGLYFEIRRGKISLNPLYYLSKKAGR